MANKLKNTISLFISENKYPLLLVGLILACMWPLSFFVFVPKWDNVNGYLAYRYFISDYLWNGHLPLWNPFQRLGYPGYADLQSGCWNPIVWFLMLFGKYTIGSLIVELLLYHVIAGLGMYKLGNYFYNNPKTSFIIALCYALSGFMVGSSQLMVFLVGAAWLPWCIYGVLKFLTTFRIKYVVLTSLFIALCTSAVSPAYTIVLVYIVVFIFAYFLWKNRANILNVRRVLIGGSLMLVFSLLLLLPYINSFLEFAPYFNRIGKLDYDEFLLSNPFLPINYVSFIFPYSVIAATDVFNQTDLSLRNGYFGVVGLVFFLAAVFSKKQKYSIILIGVFALSLLLAAGSETFIYKWVYKLPGFGVFRHPSFFRTYTLFVALLLAGSSLCSAIMNNKLSKLQNYFLYGVGLLVVVIIGYSFTKSSLTEVVENISNVYHHREFSEHSIYTHILVNALILVLLLMVVVLAKKIFKLSLFFSLFLFVILDLGIQTRLSAPTTIYYNFSYQSIAAYFDNLPNEIYQGDNDRALKYLDEKQGLKSTDGIWQNLSTYNKTLSYVGVNPMRFRSFDDAKKSGALDKIIENSIMYFSDPNESVIESKKIGYNKFRAKINNKTSSAQKFVLNQNYHHQWSAYYNGASLAVKKENDMVMAVEIPPNSEGEIEFIYESPRTLYFAIVSVLSYLILGGYLLKTRKKMAI